jgi:hypothetical protein
MSPFLSRSARFLQRAAFSGLACLAVLLTASLASSSGTREGVTQEALHEASEQLGALLAQASGDPGDLDGSPALPGSALALPVSAWSAPRPVSPTALAPRGDRRARPASRGPPVRA